MCSSSSGGRITTSPCLHPKLPYSGGSGCLATLEGYPVVQCKNYRVCTVGEPVLRDLFGGVNATDAAGAYLVTTGRLTGLASVWIRGKLTDATDGRRQHTDALVNLRACVVGASLIERTNRRSGERFLVCSGFHAGREAVPTRL